MDTLDIVKILTFTLGSAAAGCAGTTVSPCTPVHESSQTAHATLVVGEITHPRDLKVSAPFYVAMQREAFTQLDSVHVADRVVAERDLGPTGISGKAYALRYRVVEDHVIITNTGVGCRMALSATGGIVLIPLFFIGLCTSTAEHRLSIEARVFDLDGATVSKVRDDNSNELLNVYDTSTLTPVLRKEYSVNVIVTQGIFTVPAGDAFIEYEKQEAAEAVRQVLAGSLGDVGHAIDQRRVASR